MNRFVTIAGRQIDTDLWITFFRSMLALALGVLLLANNQWADHILGNFIGGFWFGIGLISIRWGIADNRSRVATFAAGTAAILAGGLAYGRGVLVHRIPGHVIMPLLGIVAIAILRPGSGPDHATGDGLHVEQQSMC